MEIGIGEILRILVFASVFTLSYWLGWRGGEIFASIKQRRFYQRLSPRFMPGWNNGSNVAIIYWLVYPMSRCIIHGVNSQRILLEYMWFIPMLAGSVTGIAMVDKISARGRCWTIISSGYIVGLASVALGYHWYMSMCDTGNLPPVAPWLIVSSGMVVLYLEWRNIYFGLRYSVKWVHSFRVVSLESIDDQGLLRQRLEAILADSKVLRFSPLHRSSQLIEAQLVDRQTKCHALVTDQALFLRFVEGFNDKIWKAIIETNGESTQELKLQSVWMMVDWQNVELVKVDKMIGYSESRLRLKNSGMELTIFAVPKAMLRWTAPAEGELKVT